MFYEKLIAWTFNLMLFGGDVILLVGLARSTKLRTLFISGLGLLFGSVLLAGVLGRHPFLIMRLVSYAIFLHAPLVLLAAAWLFGRRSRKACVGLLLLVGVLTAVGVDAFLIEPHWLSETNIELTSNKLQATIRVAIIADLQTDQLGAYEKHVFQRCLASKPDVILMAGDYVQVSSTESWERLRRDLNAYLHEIGFAAPLGIYAVQGNVDHPQWMTLFENLPVHLIDQTTSVDSGALKITGLHVNDSFNRNLDVAKSPLFHIVLGHAPDFALGNVQADLLVAGHTHGGQVCIPGIGPLMTASQVPRKWATGITQVAENRTLIVSRGIGMERQSAPRLRFLCRPELVVLDVKPAIEPVATASVSRGVETAER